MSTEKWQSPLTLSLNAFVRENLSPKSLPLNASPIETFEDKPIGGLNRGGDSPVCRADTGRGGCCKIKADPSAKET
ncbi:MAG TPA: hypothetical protein DCQ99_02760 [Nitrospinae bacterium]|nr:hypothetical protein [Nitrospinota bacterium]HBA26515.1 hypothetical protein [Nitrospinota bacterium]